MRQQRKDVSPKKLNENWEAISPVSLSAVLRENFSSFRSTLHNFLSHIVLFNVWNLLLLRSEGEVQTLVRRRSYYLNLYEAHGLNTWGQLPHLMKNGRKFNIMRRTSCTSLSRVLSTCSSCSTSLASPTSLSQEQQDEVRIWVNKHKETCSKPSHRTTNKHGETCCRLNCHEGRCNRKKIHTHFLKDRNWEMQEGQNYLDSMQETHRWSHSSSSKIWRLEDPWWNKTSQGRHGVISWNLALVCEVDHGITEKSKSTPHRSKRFEIAE